MIAFVFLFYKLIKPVIINAGQVLALKVNHPGRPCIVSTDINVAGFHPCSEGHGSKIRSQIDLKAVIFQRLFDQLTYNILFCKIFVAYSYSFFGRLVI